MAAKTTKIRRRAALIGNAERVEVRLYSGPRVLARWTIAIQRVGAAWHQVGGPRRLMYRARRAGVRLSRIAMDAPRDLRALISEVTLQMDPITVRHVGDVVTIALPATAYALTDTYADADA